jgi:hypothetical protein
MNYSPEDILTSDGFLNAFPAYYFKTDVLVMGRTIHWRGRLHEPPMGRQLLILAGHSDFPLTDDIVRRYPSVLWFASNTQSNKVRGLPLGITNDTDESPLHRIYGNKEIMVEALRQPVVYKNVCYMNFVIDTFPSVRGPLFEMMKDKPWVTVGTPVATLEGRKAFLQEIRSHKFVLCPRGNGVDTHRLWETLYMGSIPIVIYDITHKDWTDLPILFIQDWSQITEEFLDSEYTRILNTRWNFSKLKMSYWIEKIKNARR